MTPANTLSELLAANRGVQRSIAYVDGENSERVVSFEELYQRALGILYHLQSLGARPGDKMILYVANNEQFVDAFCGAILGGIVPVPVALGISDEHKRKLLRIARLLAKPFLYTDRRTLDRIAAFASEDDDATTVGELTRRAFLADTLEDISKPGKIHAASPDDTAFIQFSSGSTSDPKGIVLTHRNILTNARGAGEAAAFSETDIALSWMPLTHDMGLIGMFIMMYAHRMQLNIMTTELFVRRPLLWMQVASRKRITITTSPNFGFRHYLKVLGDRGVTDLDLSSIRLLFNGAEPISAPLAREFIARMQPAKLAPRAMYPVYGLAEATLAVSFPRLGASMSSLALDRHQLSVGTTIREIAADGPDAAEFVAVGVPVPYCNLRIVSDADEELPDGQVGHIQISGDNVTRGYYENQQANAAGFTNDGWLRTGDLGVRHADLLYITGRAKEIIFVNGQNYYPHDLESIAYRADGLELGKVVAAGVRPPGASTDELTLFVLHRGGIEEFLPVATAAARLVNEHTGLEVAHTVPVRRIPKTTSGKIQRHLLEAAYLEGEFAPDLAALATLRAQLAQAGGTAVTSSHIEAILKEICDTALERGMSVDENLFELGASSLKLIEIHEKIDEQYPGHVDLTELFDYPTIAELARHLESKLVAGAGVAP
ncbi:MAG: non-ribosomal peptide synthetase [Pseudomonadales bacterium]|nr:non-ribosomal peptide synthetase [Pseudomonadales bacterium]